MARALISDTWFATRAQFEDDDLDTVFRLRTQMPVTKTRTTFHTLMIIKWPYQPKKDGMPREKDLRRMGSFEDALEVSVEAPVLGIQVACLTGNGRRTWRYFVAEPAAFLRAVKPLLETHGPGPHMFRKKEDAKWAGLSELLPLLECLDEDG